MSAAIQPLPQYTFMAWCSVTKTQRLYLPYASVAVTESPKFINTQPSCKSVSEKGYKYNGPCPPTYFQEFLTKILYRFMLLTVQRVRALSFRSIKEPG